MTSPIELHEHAVAKISSTVRGFYERGEPFRIAHGNTNSTRPRTSTTNELDISHLRNVLSVNTSTRTALVEPNVPMDKLVEATLPHGLVPPVVTEFPGITVGGAFAGTAGESSSFRYGFFSDNIVEVEMVLGDGAVVRASKSECHDLFHGAAGAVGTLGVTTLVELQLIQAKKFVKTVYHRTHSVEQTIATVRKETENAANDYVDGILFSREHGVVITGTLIDDKPAGVTPQTFSDAWDPWFYLHVKERTSVSSAVEYIPLAEYLFRYDRGGFWVGAGAFGVLGWLALPFTRFARWLMDDLLHTRMLYRFLHASGISARFVVQDVVLPYVNAEDFVAYTAEEFGIWPLWLCPLRQTQDIGKQTFHPHTGPGEVQVLNIGLWGWGPANAAAFVHKNRALEAKVGELGGMKWLYAHTYYPAEDFWKLYDYDWYDALRNKYRATTLPSVHDKVAVNVDKGATGVRRLPLSGLGAIWESFRSKDYLLHREAGWKYKKEES